MNTFFSVYSWIFILINLIIILLAYNICFKIIDIITHISYLIRNEWSVLMAVSVIVLSTGTCHWSKYVY